MANGEGAKPAANIVHSYVNAGMAPITRANDPFWNIRALIKSLKFDYILSNPAASFRSLHESLINYGNNKQPEFLTCMHEESAVGMAHGYFKIAGRPLSVLLHGTVGLQHASMAIYNAWCDRVPVVVIGGNHLDASRRPPGVPTFHAAQDPNAIVRDFTKWDDQPVSLSHFAESMVRAYRISMTPPMSRS